MRQIEKTDKSSHCDLQGIVTLDKWIKHYKDVTKKENNDFGKLQCGFDITKNGAKTFALAIDAKNYLRQNSQKYGWKHTELRIKAWNEEYPEKIPIEAFFYVIFGANEADQTEKGKERALHYQTDYHSQTGEWRPIVGIRLPTKNNLTIHIETA